MSENLFGWTDDYMRAEHPHPLSADQKRTLKRKQLLDQGIHPLTRVSLLEPVGELTCGDCEHHVVRRLGGTYHKCLRHETSGPATDIRVSWPACKLFEFASENVK